MKVIGRGAESAKSLVAKADSGSEVEERGGRGEFSSCLGTMTGVFSSWFGRSGETERFTMSLRTVVIIGGGGWKGPSIGGNAENGQRENLSLLFNGKHVSS